MLKELATSSRLVLVGVASGLALAVALTGCHETDAIGTSGDTDVSVPDTSADTAGACSTAADCSDLLIGECQVADCVSETCVAVPDTSKEGTSCGDGDVCLTGNTCSAGVCGGGAPKDCTGLDAGTCVVGACAPETGDCVARPAPTDTPCDDGEACTSNDTCNGGTCAGSPIDCSAFDTLCATGTCDSGICSAVPAPGKACTPTDPCVTNAGCDLAGQCVGTYDTTLPGCGCESATDCDDALDCTTDTCDTVTGSCSNDVIAGNCLIDGACYGDGGPVGGSACALCDPNTNQATATAPDCDDGDDCTQDSCDSALGCVNNVDLSVPGCGCTGPGQCDDGIDCSNDVCDLASGECLFYAAGCNATVSGGARLMYISGTSQSADQTITVRSVGTAPPFVQPSTSSDSTITVQPASAAGN